MRRRLGRRAGAASRGRSRGPVLGRLRRGRAAARGDPRPGPDPAAARCVRDVAARRPRCRRPQGRGPAGRRRAARDAAVHGVGESGVFVALCRGKRSIALDLKHDDGRALMLELVARSQVLIDSFRPGVLDRLGLGPDALAAANPVLVHVSMTAYGDGARRTLPGHDLNAEGYAGLLGLARGHDGTIGMPAQPVADMATGLQAALAVVSGLRLAERGEPLRADVTMLDSALSLTGLAQGAVAATGSAPPTPDVLTGGLASYGTYRCADGLEVAVGALEPQFFGRAMELVGRPELAARQYDVTGQDSLRGELTTLFAERPRADWLALLEHDQTCITPVRTVADALDDEDLRERGVVVDVGLADGSRTPLSRSAAWSPPRSGSRSRLRPWGSTPTRCCASWAASPRACARAALSDPAPSVVSRWSGIGPGP
ncbi:MAG: CoA transferase [Candidatus Nanopelagicales bacterium]